MKKEEKYEIVTKYIIENQNKFYRLAYSYVKNEEIAMDVVQNAICKALETYDSIRNTDYIRTWFYRVLVNESLGVLKKNSREYTSDPETMPEEAYEDPEYDDTGKRLFEKVNALPEKVKTVIILRFYEEMSLNEIAEITGDNLNTVKTRLYSGLRTLKVTVKEEEMS